MERVAYGAKMFLKTNKYLEKLHFENFHHDTWMKIIDFTKLCENVHYRQSYPHLCPCMKKTIFKITIHIIHIMSLVIGCCHICYILACGYKHVCCMLVGINVVMLELVMNRIHHEFILIDNVKFTLEQ
jgi:hypothetical protein